jgi:hypothetical protein
VKALTLTQPWATLVAVGAKRIETRSWSTNYRGPIAIHAAKGFPDYAEQACHEEPFRSVLRDAGITRIEDLSRGCIVAVAELVDCWRFGPTAAEVVRLGSRDGSYPRYEAEFGDYSGGRYGFLLNDVGAQFCGDVRGALGLWDVPETVFWQLPGRPVFAPAARAAAPIEGLKKGQQKLLDALAELEALGIRQTNRVQLGMFAGYNLTGGSGAQHIADLVSAGLVTMPEPGAITLTDTGRGTASAAAVPGSLDELHARVYAKVTQGQQKILAHLIAIYPNAISRAELGQATQYNLTGGSGAQHVADLINAGAAVMPAQGKVAASAFLFPEGLA